MHTAALFFLFQINILDRYEAALIIKRACLKDLPLGNIMQLLNMIITIKKWIIPPQIGWQPIIITLAETKSDVDTTVEA